MNGHFCSYACGKLSCRIQLRYLEIKLGFGEMQFSYEELIIQVTQAGPKKGRIETNWDLETYS